MAKKPLEGYITADSRSLPKIDSYMLYEFLFNDNFVQPEVRNVKTLRACDPNYGDNAIGYTQVHRDGIICTVRSEICPQHRIHDKNYQVYCVIDETEDDESILEATCEDCVASAGGCKHIIAFLFYLHRKSEEDPATSLECLWKRPRLSGIGRTVKTERISISHPYPKLKRVIKDSEVTGFRNFLMTDLQAVGSSKATALNHLSKTQTLSIHHLMLSFKQSDRNQDGESFLQYCSSYMSEEDCEKVSRETVNQSDSTSWFLYRQSRVTASRIWEASRCTTTDGCLVNSILGAKGVPDTEAMARGRMLEPKVLAVVSKHFGGKIRRTGLLLNKAHPELGASPDGLLNDYVLEVKCPSSERAVQSYFSNDFSQPSSKYLAQIMTQMHFCGKTKGIFCVADPLFDGKSNKKVKTLVVHKDDAFLQPVLVKARKFWVEFIYSKVYATT